MPAKSRRSKPRARKTRRAKRTGGADPPPVNSNERLKEIIAATKASPVIINPASKFVVVTYWWGGDNKNANTQRPCPEDLGDAVKADLMKEHADQDADFKLLYDAAAKAETDIKAARAAKSEPTPEQKMAFSTSRKARNAAFLNWFKTDATQALYKSRIPLKKEELITQKQFCQPTTYREMISHWEASCRRHNCNYLAVEYPDFAKPGGYQMAINAKPLFIKKSLELCKGRGVLYIDGDMFVNKYPRIFDLPNVDFMARNWNSDPRSNEKYLEGDICFDPYVFETSGGTMFFADSVMSHRLLDDWWAETADPKSTGKADDRILSMVYTQKNYLMYSTQIGLPIEYLWLTDLYDFQEVQDANLAGSYLEHPECLTGEERAAELSVSTVSREPEGYDQIIGDKKYCERTGGFFYEYIFFPTKEDVETMKLYLEYLRNAENQDGDNPFYVVNYDDKYGSGQYNYNSVAQENETAAAAETVPEQAGQTASLGMDATPAQIVARLKKGVHVSVGGGTELPNVEFVVTLKDPSQKDAYTPRIQVDVTKPMFIHSGNPVIHHLFMMSKTLEDLNTHLKNSFVFVSRIRWSTPEGPFAISGQAPSPSAPASEPVPATEPAVATEPTPATEPAVATEPAPATEPAVATEPAPAPAPAPAADSERRRNISTS